MILQNAFVDEEKINSLTEQLRISNDKFNAVFNNSPASIVITDIDSKIIINANHTFEQVMGYCVDEVIGKSVLELNIWGDPVEREKIIPLLLQAGYAHIPQLVLRKKSGELAIVNAHCSLINIGNQMYGISHFIDITDIKRTEQKFSAMFNAIPDAVMFADTDRRIMMNNPAVLTMFGYPDEELLGHNTEMLYADNKDFIEQGKRRYRIGPGTEKNSYEVKYKRKDGSTFWSESRGTQVNDENGNPIGFIGLFRDITERKNAEYENAKLQKQLEQSHKMEAIGHLTGGIAHDFNNILAVILGFASLSLRRPEIDSHAELRSYLDEIVKSGERARDLIRQMLAFSRKSNPNVQQLVLAPFISEILNMMKATIPSSIELTCQIEQDIPTISIDPLQLQQVLMNIYINARDSIGSKGTIDIHVFRNTMGNTNSAKNIITTCNSCFKAISKGDYVEISVSDTGSGISEFILKKIFDPFFTTKEIINGSGMGLSIVHGIVHQHKGHILIETEPGCGTNFRLLFPLGVDGAVSQPRNDSPVTHVTNGLDNAHILIADDEKSVARFISDLIDSAGGRSTIVYDGGQAYDLITRDPAAFDLVISDQTMPVLTGLELSQKLLQVRPDLPLILCTGHSDHLDAEVAALCGAKAFLKKPIDIDILLQQIQQLLPEQAGSRRAANVNS